MKIKNFSLNKDRLVFQFVMTGSQEEIWKFIESLSVPVLTSMNYRKVNEGEGRISFKCSSEEAYKELYQKIDDVILEYIV